MAKIVNSWDEWSPLKRTIVGRVHGTQIPAPEPNWVYPAPKGGFPLGTWGMFPEEMVEKADAQMSNFVNILEKRGIIVDRVELHPVMLKPIAVSTPDWTQLNMRGIACPRDVFIVVGNEIIETAGCHRSRWYEYLNLRPVFQQYFKEDPEFLWNSAPKPRLTEKSYKPNWDYNCENVWTDEEKERFCVDWDYQLTEEEPLWDAADCARAGKDLFWNLSAVCNRAGVDWVTRHYAQRGIRVHPVKFDCRKLKFWKPWHIDGEFTMLRPGVLITNPDFPIMSPEIIDLFRKNDWEIIEAARPVHEYNHDISLIYNDSGGGCYGKSWISMNTFSLGPNTICVEGHETGYCEQLDKMGVEVVPVPYDEVIPFGGELHCTTLDIYRESKLEDYFPNQ
ncbi:MAG: serine/threonine protein kinase [Desulfovibrionaceae bacterium]|nr:serine/threonine protein kinase [Desulfovibrionaceae bacterium]